MPLIVMPPPKKNRQLNIQKEWYHFGHIWGFLLLFLLLLGLSPVLPSPSGVLSSFFLSSLLSMDLGKWTCDFYLPWVHCRWDRCGYLIFLRSKIVLLVLHWLLSNFVAICRWALKVLFIASWDSSHNIRFWYFWVSSFLPNKLEYNIYIDWYTMCLLKYW